MSLHAITMIRSEDGGTVPRVLEVRPVLQFSSEGEDLLLGQPVLMDAEQLGDLADAGDTFFVVRPSTRGPGFHPVATVRRMPRTTTGEAGEAADSRPRELASFDAEARPTRDLFELPRF